MKPYFLLIVAVAGVVVEGTADARPPSVPTPNIALFVMRGDGHGPRLIDQHLRQHMVKTSSLLAMPRDVLDRKIRSVEPSGRCVDPVCQISVAGELGVPLAMGGDVTRTKGACSVSLTLFDVAENRPLGTTTATGTCTNAGLRRSADAAYTDVIRFTGKARGLQKSLGDFDILTVLRDHKDQVRACLKSSRADRKQPNGTLFVHIQIEPTGVVSDIFYDPKKFEGSSLTKCLERDMATWRFPLSQEPALQTKFPVIVRPDR